MKGIETLTLSLFMVAKFSQHPNLLHSVSFMCHEPSVIGESFPVNNNHHIKMTMKELCHRSCIDLKDRIFKSVTVSRRWSISLSILK